MSETLAPLLANMHWHIAPEFRDRLLGPEGLRLDEWLRTGQARIVKHGPHRTVYRVCLPDAEFYLKHNRLHDTGTWLRQLIRPAKARLEYDKSQAVARCGIPTITPIGIGESAGPGPADSFLITLSLRDTESLGQFLDTTIHRLEGAEQVRLRQRLAGGLGTLLARMHDAGIVHNDLHAGNFLIRLDAAAWPELFLIDLHSVAIGDPLDWEASRDNLVILNRWFSLRASRPDRLRFWRAYCRQRSDACEPSHDLRVEEDVRALELEKVTLASNLGFWRHRDRRCLVNNRYYQRLNAHGVIGHAVRDLDRSALDKLLADPDEPFTRPGVVLLKNSSSSTVAKLEIELAGRPCQVIYKRFRVTSWDDPLRNLVRASPAMRSWVLGQGLRERGLPTARPLAVFQRRRAGLVHEGYLLTEFIPDAVDVHGFLAQLRTRPPRNRQMTLRRHIEHVARLIRALHQANLSHRDLKAVNILMSPLPCPWSLVQPRPAPGEHEAWLVDLVGVSRQERLSRRRRQQNLARLNASFHHSPHLTRTDKLRFLRIYLRWGVSGRIGWKRWWRVIEALTRAKIARNRRNQRPLA